MLKAIVHPEKRVVHQNLGRKWMPEAVTFPIF
jgi:hypothetical protein